MSTLNDRLAERLKQVRATRGWSLQELADASGVSRSTLSRVENAEVSPTADTLGSLSTAYQMTISQLLAPIEAPFAPLVRADEQSVWHDTDNGFSRRAVSPPSGGLSAEVVQCELAAYQMISYAAPSVPGHEHHLVMVSGALSVTIGDAEHRLEAGDCLRYQLFGASKFQTGVDPASYFIVLV
jgi:transcriptional regulator with XRE-family HTH domain